MADTSATEEMKGAPSAPLEIDHPATSTPTDEADGTLPMDYFDDSSSDDEAEGVFGAGIEDTRVEPAELIMSSDDLDSLIGTVSANPNSQTAMYKRILNCEMLTHNLTVKKTEVKARLRVITAMNPDELRELHDQRTLELSGHKPIIPATVQAEKDAADEAKEDPAAKLIRESMEVEQLVELIVGGCGLLEYGLTRYTVEKYGTKPFEGFGDAHFDARDRYRIALANMQKNDPVGFSALVFTPQIQLAIVFATVSGNFYMERSIRHQERLNVTHTKDDGSSVSPPSS